MRTVMILVDGRSKKDAQPFAQSRGKWENYTDVHRVVDARVRRVEKAHKAGAQAQKKKKRSKAKLDYSTIACATRKCAYTSKEKISAVNPLSFQFFTHARGAFFAPIYQMKTETETERRVYNIFSDDVWTQPGVCALFSRWQVAAAAILLNISYSAVSFSHPLCASRRCGHLVQICGGGGHKWNVSQRIPVTVSVATLVIIQGANPEELRKLTTTC